MQYSLKFTGIDPTDALKAAVENKMSRIEERTLRFGDAVSTEVEIGKTTNHHHKGEIFRAEIRMRIPNGELNAEVLNEDLYVAINEAGENILRQLADLKEFLEDSKHQLRPDKE